MLRRQTLILMILGLLFSVVPFSTTTAQSGICGDTVTVVAGDTLSEIATRCNTTVSAIVAANPGLQATDTLLVNQVIVMPSATGVPQTEPPIVAISPMSGPPGTVINMVASGFPTNVPVVVGIGRTGTEYEVVSRPVVGQRGSVYQAFPLPSYAETGEPWVVVVETNNQAARAVSYEFIVTDGAGDNGQGAFPNVSLAPTSGRAGTTLNLTATGYPPNASAIIGVGRQNLNYRYSLREEIASNGSLNTTITIPEDAAAGTNWQVVVQVESNRDYAAFSNLFVVTGPDTSPDGVAVFEEAYTYLVALEDNGQTGPFVGCEDSLVPIRVNFAPTIAPLTAALEELLAIDEEFYGQSGLYNALHQSNLSVVGIDIENGLATINLTGDIIASGACDAPRIIGQLEYTALQYSTVSSVEIFVDGVPLEQVVSAAN